MAGRLIFSVGENSKLSIADFFFNVIAGAGAGASAEPNAYGDAAGVADDAAVAPVRLMAKFCGNIPLSQDFCFRDFAGLSRFRPAT